MTTIMVMKRERKREGEKRFFCGLVGLERSDLNRVGEMQVISYV
jgi:hypothetical protein